MLRIAIFICVMPVFEAIKHAHRVYFAEDKALVV